MSNSHLDEVREMLNAALLWFKDGETRADIEDMLLSLDKMEAEHQRKLDDIKYGRLPGQNQDKNDDDNEMPNILPWIPYQ